MAGTTRKAGGGFTAPDADGWIEHRGDTYRYQVFLTGPVGHVTAVAAGVPGVTAVGGTEDEALGNIRLALTDILRAAKATGGSVPRSETPPQPGALSRWVIVRLNG